ncbi:hypothetical protein G195_008065 [Phytophthora kernoviae 00238/432]|uniref:Protein NO VEIN C-terminal domain-containing protein n=1 Tax=Phytophthora kernoviae 00238/432 TaxID=1284355 RepID=A0A8J4S3V0_9STRA|nr:hypothetical protein G195_008065 [Phytophthora kernoviae 00238/432]
MMNITTREVLTCLKQFETMLGHDAFRASSHIDLNEFLLYLAQQYRQPSAQAMGVSVDPSGFGVYVGMLRRVANQEMKEMKSLEQEFQREVAEKVFQLTKEKFSTDNRQQALEDLLEQTNARSTQSSDADDKGKKARGGKKNIMQSLSLDMLKRVTDVDVYLDNVLRRKAAADAKNQNKFRKPISSQEIAETDTKLRNQLTRFLVSSQKSKHHSRLKVVTWVICSIMAKTYALLLSDDKLPDEVSDLGLPSVEEAIKFSGQESTGDNIIRSSIIKYASTVDVTRDCDVDDMIARDGATGESMQLKLLTDEALAKLRQCPCLVDVSLFMNWQERSESNFPKQLVQAHLRAYLSDLPSNRLSGHSKESKREVAKKYAERFVLEVLLETPVEFAEFVLSFLLNVLAQAIGAKSSDEWGVADDIWNACMNDVERKTLMLISKRNASPLWASQTQKWCDSRGNLMAAYNNDGTEVVDNGDTAVERSSTSIGVVEGDSLVSSVAFSNTSESDVALATFSNTVSRPEGVEPPQSEQHDSDSCRLFIDDLRKKQFGVGLEIQDAATMSVLLIQQQRLERALKRLSDELYSESTHFVLELLQNADDNAYDDTVIPLGEFTLTENQDIVFYNNERGFSPANIQAICDVGASTKGASDSETSIGKKGIGFKSVFKVSDNPQVHSNGFHICFHAKNAQHGNGMGYILPYWLEDATQWRQQRGTTFVLPLNDASVQRVNDISLSLMMFEPSVLLFLRRICELRLRDVVRRHALHFLKKEKQLQANVQIVQLYSRTLQQGKNDVEVAQQNWLVVKEKLEPPPLFGRDRPTEIAIAFPFASQDDHTNDPADRPPLQQVFAFLPLRSYGFRFILHGDFEIPSSREAITNGSEWNEWVVSKFPKLVRAAVSSYIAGIFSLGKSKASDTNADDDTKTIAAISHLVSLLPFDNEVQSPFRRIIPEIMRELRQVRWLACASSNQASSTHEMFMPTELIDCTELTGSDVSASMTTLLEALSGDTLASTFSKRFLHPALSRIMSPLLKTQLRIEQLHSSHVMRVLSLSVDKNDIKWTVKMLALLAKLWRKDRHSSLLRQELRLIKCFPLQRTHKDDTIKWLSLAEGHDSLFVSSDQVDNVASRQFAGKQSYEFYGDLRILDETFTEAVGKSSKLHAFLMNDVGIHVMEDHDLISHHILPKMKLLRTPSDEANDDNASKTNIQGVLEYGRFLASHLALCERCPMRADVKDSMVVVTSTNNFAAVDASDLFVILPSTFKSMPQVSSWIAAKMGGSDQNKKGLAIVSSVYFADTTNSSDHTFLDAQWGQLFVEVCGLPLLIDSGRLMSNAHGMEQVLKWVEQEDDATLKCSISTHLTQYLDNHWKPREGNSTDSMGVTTSDDLREQDKLSLDMWKKYQWLEGSDGQFYCPTDLWLSEEVVTRLFTPDMEITSEGDERKKLKDVEINVVQLESSLDDGELGTLLGFAKIPTLSSHLEGHASTWCKILASFAPQLDNKKNRKKLVKLEQLVIKNWALISGEKFGDDEQFRWNAQHLKIFPTIDENFLCTQAVDMYINDQVDLPKSDLQQQALDSNEQPQREGFSVLGLFSWSYFVESDASGDGSSDAARVRQFLMDFCGMKSLKEHLQHEVSVLSTQRAASEAFHANPNAVGAPFYPPLPAPAPGPGMSSLSLTNTMTKEEREAIGRWGEEYVFNQLKQQHVNDETNLTVDWVNEQEESGLPYDLTLSSAGKVVEYIEVKSTRTMEKGVFEISMNELDQAAIHGSTYSIYRVFNAGNSALCRVIRMKNPVSLVRQRKIQLALVMQ